MDVIGDRLMNTIWLSLFSVILIYVIGIPLGLISGRYKDSMLDSVITGYTYLGFATPTFVFGLVLLWIFGYHFGTFPTNGSVGAGLEAGSVQYILSKLNHLILPSFSIALIGLVGTVQYLRSAPKHSRKTMSCCTCQRVNKYISNIYSMRSYHCRTDELVGFGGSIFMNGYMHIREWALFLESIQREASCQYIDIILWISDYRRCAVI